MVILGTEEKLAIIYFVQIRIKNNDKGLAIKVIA
jgi:hypothetical protein